MKRILLSEIITIIGIVYTMDRIAKQYAKHIVYTNNMLYLLNMLKKYIKNSPDQLREQEDLECKYKHINEVIYIKNLIRTIITLRHEKYIFNIVEYLIKHVNRQLYYNTPMEQDGYKYYRDKRYPTEKTAMKIAAKKLMKKKIGEEFYG